MSSLFDSHNHFFNSPGMSDDINACVLKNVELMSVCSINENDWPTISLLSEQYLNIKPQFGIHPWFALNVIDGWSERLELQLRRFTNAGVGECGLDKSDKYKDSIDEQMSVFRKQIGLASKLKRPLSIHCVKAWLELFDVLGEFRGKISGVIHSFSGSSEMMLQLVKAGFYISYSPFILKNLSKKTIKAIVDTPIDRLLIETDSPDTRVIDKSFSNPAGLTLVLEKVSEIRNESISVIAASTYGNAMRLFDV